MGSANNDLQNVIRLARHYWRTNTLRAALVSNYSSRLHSTQPLPLLYLCLYPYYPLLYLYSAQLYSILFSTLPLLYSSLLFSTLLCYTSALLFSTILYSTHLHLYSASILPLPRLYFTQVPTGHSDLWLGRMWLHDLLTQVPTGHNDLWASENVSYWSLKAHANWTQWSLG